METIITNPDTLENVNVTVDEGPLPYTVQVTFGPHYSILMNAEDARELGQLLASAGVEV